MPRVGSVRFRRFRAGGGSSTSLWSEESSSLTLVIVCQPLCSLTQVPGPRHQTESNEENGEVAKATTNQGPRLISENRGAVQAQFRVC